MQQGSETLNLQQAIGVLRRRLPLIALCAVVVAGAAFVYSESETKKYTATASLIFSDNPLSQQIAGLPQNSANLLAQQASDLELVKLGDMSEKTAALLGHGLTAEKVAGSVNISGQGESSVVTVSATSPSPTLAAQIANTYAHQFVTEQQSSNTDSFRSALELVERQIAAIPPQQRYGAAAVTLQSRAQTLRLLEELKYGNVQVAQDASPPASPSSPKTSRNALLGLLLGLLLGVGLVFVLERLNRDRRINGPADMEAVYDLPLLGAVPSSPALERDTGGGQAALPPAAAESFNLIRARLQFFNIDRDLCTILVTSATPGDGKTTVARHLAEAAARRGSRTLLLEADLRHPTLAGHLNIQPGPGLPDVLIGAASLEEAVQSVSLGTSPAPDHDAFERHMDVLACGVASPANPSELLESHTMKALIEQAKSVYDLVVIDTPPLTVVSDAFPLLAQVDGVIVVGWIGRSRRDASELLHRTLTNSQAVQLGVIANGLDSGIVDPDTYLTPNTYLSHAAAEASPSMPSDASSSMPVSTNGASPSEEPVSSTSA
jgi:polysaccharide biosynthesis transport protein